MATKNIYRKKVKKLETTTLRKGYELGANVSGMNILKNQQFFFLILKNKDLKIQYRICC